MRLWTMAKENSTIASASARHSARRAAQTSVGRFSQCDLSLRARAKDIALLSLSREPLSVA